MPIVHLYTCTIGILGGEKRINKNFDYFFKITSSAGTDTGADCGGITLTVALAE